MSTLPLPIQTFVQHLNASMADWASVTTPPPNGLLIYESTGRTFRFGDGVNLFIDLPVVFTLNDVITVLAGLNSKSDVGHTHEISQIIGMNGGGVVSTIYNILSPDIVSSWTPNRANGPVQNGTVTSVSLTISNMILPANFDTAEMIVFLRSSLAGGSILNAGANVIYTGGDGLIMLPNTTYILRLLKKGTKTLMSTTQADGV